MFKRLGIAPFLVHMMWEKISGLARMQYNIRLGDGAAGSLPGLVDSNVFKM